MPDATMTAMEFMEVEIVLDDKVTENLERLGREGWVPFPAVPPKGRWLLMRPVQQVQQQSFVQNVGYGTFGIDDRKIGILRNGKFVDNDGNEVPPPG